MSTTQLNLSELTPQQAQIAQQLIGPLSVHYQTEMLHVLLEILHKFTNECLSVDCLQSIGERFKIDLESEYYERLGQLTDEDAEEEW